MQFSLFRVVQVEDPTPHFVLLARWFKVSLRAVHFILPIEVGAVAPLSSTPRVPFLALRESPRRQPSRSRRQRRRRHPCPRRHQKRAM
jgi:hypothetical protein